MTTTQANWVDDAIRHLSMATTETLQRYCSYDFFPGDTLYVEGVRLGYVTCTVETPDGLEPYYGFTEPVADIADLDAEKLARSNHCVHLALLVLADAPGWRERVLGGSGKLGQVVYPALNEHGMVVPLP